MGLWGGEDDFYTGGTFDPTAGWGYGDGGNTPQIPQANPPVAPSFPVASAGASSTGDPANQMPGGANTPGATWDPFAAGGGTGGFGGGGGGFGVGSNPLDSFLSAIFGRGRAGSLGSLFGGGGGDGGLLSLLGGGGGDLSSLAGLLSLFGGSAVSSLFPGGAAGSSGLGGLAGMLPGLLGGTLTGGSPLSGIAGGLGGGVAGLLGGSGPNYNAGTAGIGGGLGGGIGALAGLPLGPLGSLGGAFLGDLLGSLAGGYIGGGLPKMAKPQGFVNALQGSGDPLESLLGGYMQKYGINKGIPLSTSGPTPGFQPTAMANVLELLGGMQMKDLHGTTLTPPGQIGYKNPVGLAARPLNYLQGLMPNATELGSAQLKQIMPEIENILMHRGQYGHGLQALLEGENTLATKLQQATTY